MKVEETKSEDHSEIKEQVDGGQGNHASINI